METLLACNCSDGDVGVFCSLACEIGSSGHAKINTQCLPNLFESFLAVFRDNAEQHRVCALSSNLAVALIPRSLRNWLKYIKYCSLMGAGKSKETYVMRCLPRR